eukprot:TRINITY_DN8912_c0_g2_i1.p1 TRINITY_DN8912_c0_g2~~TRINITY_DN8912_c0_g2_i1.p1  ORF type:complete len:124 (+),score=26.53 TRINITY_DN8912_c0_g2_i1:104-475(+)
MSLTGQQVRQVIEQQLQGYPIARGCHPHFSKAWKIVFNPHAQPLNRVVSIHINEQELQPDQSYRICCTAFMASGGDQVSTFLEGTKLSKDEDEKIVSQVVLEYLRQQEELDASLPRRLVEVNV